MTFLWSLPCSNTVPRKCQKSCPFSGFYGNFKFHVATFSNSIEHIKFHEITGISLVLAIPNSRACNIYKFILSGPNLCEICETP